MKRIGIIILVLLTCLVGTYAATRYYGDIDGDEEVTIKDVAALVEILNGATDESEGASDVDRNGTVDEDDLDSLVNIILYSSDLVEVGECDALYITYANGTASYQMPSSWADYLTVSIDEGNVTVTNTNTDTEYTTYLSGTCSDGSFTYNGTYKTTFILNGLDLTSSDGAAINILCGKRINVELADGTKNTLVDGSEGSQKAALYCKGHMEFSGAGSLSVTGNTKHAISSKEYILLKKTTGSITIDGSANDGIHCGQYFQMNGGTVSISGTSGDGIQTEMEEDQTEDDGKIIIKGGTIDITTEADDVAAMKCDSTLHIIDGTITLTTTGDASKGMKTNYNVEIEGGTVTITQEGSYLVESVTDTDGNVTYDASYSTAIKADGDIDVSDGTLTITNSADGGKGLSSDGNVNVSGGEQNIYIYGSGGVLDTSRATSSESEDDETETTKSYKFYVTLPSSATSSNSGGGGPGGNNTSSISWSDIEILDSSKNVISDISGNQESKSGSDGTSATFFYYDFAAATSGTYYISASYSITKSGSGRTSTGTYTSSSLTLSLTGSDVYYGVTVSSSSGMQGGSSYSFSISDVTSTYSGGTTAAEEGDTYSSAGIKSDGNVTLAGGTQTIDHTGTISKGIKADGAVTLSGSEVSVSSGGTYLLVGTDPSYCTAVKCGSFVGESGTLTVDATGAASRGISSDGTIDINDGTYSLELSGDGTTYTANGESDGIASVGLKSDGNMTLIAGSITVNNEAKGGKGIKAGQTVETNTDSETQYANGSSLIIGTEGADNSLLTLDVNTTGYYLSTTSSSGFGGGDMNEGFVGSPKAVKVMGPITVNSGNIHLSTISDGGEGLESKYTITFNGGILESDTYDDAVNAKSLITVNDGYIWAHASGNDGMDSNGSGFIFNGGVTLASGTSAPEEGFDCDRYNFVINGGVLIGTGGATSSVTSATQRYATISGLSTKEDTYLSIKNSSGTVLATYKLPNTVSSTTVLVSHPNLTSSSTLVYGASSVSGTTSSVWDGVYSTGGTLSGGSSKTFSASTK